SQSQELFDVNRQIAHAPAGGVIHRVGNRGRHADAGNLAEALGTDGVEPRIRLVDEVDLEAADVGVHRHLVFGNVGIEEAAEAIVDLALLAERGADAPDESAVDLTPGRS